MVSVVFAIWPSLTPERPAQSRTKAPAARERPAAGAQCPCFGRSSQQATCQFAKPSSALLGFDIAWPYRARAEVNDVNDVPGLSEPHGPDGAVADRGFIGAEIPQPRAAGDVRQAVRTARRGA